MSSDQTLPANRLIEEASSYLRRHAYQPVDWYPWGPEAFEKAVEEDRPVLLSIGYASNQWCARMEAESFSNERVAGFMNARFVCVKVDREERPDLDAHFMEALEVISGEARYPVTLFLTPEGKPFYGGSYYPPEAGDGLPAFGSVLNEVAVLWQRTREETVRRSREIEQDIGRSLEELPDREPLSPALLQQAVFTVQSAFDEEYGGFGQPPKFPQPSILEFMLRASARGTSRAIKVVDLTLQNMARGGMFDQIGGGFFRFSTDAAWLVPRFEKTLYDNAQLARVYTHAWQLLRNPLYKRVALETLEYLTREMTAPSGVFYSSESADAAGDYYTWAFDELDEIAPQAAGYYGVTRTGNLNGRNVLTASSDEPLTKARAALLKHRTQRGRPERDEKVLTSWNGLAIGALAEAGAAFDRPDLIEEAKRAALYLYERHRDGSTGRLYHSYKDADHKVLGMLEDYAYLAEGLYTLWEVTFEPEWIDACDSLCSELLELFWDGEEGGLFTTGADHGERIPRRKEYLDPATPAASAVAASVLYRLGVLAGDEKLTARAREIVEEAQPHIQGLFVDACAMVCAIELQISSLTEIAIVGPVTDGRTRALRQQLWQRYLPNKVAAGSPPGITSPLLDGRKMIGDAPTAYVGQGDLVKPPITDPEEFAGSVKFWAPPVPEQVQKVAGLVSNSLQRRHFFDNLQNPAWIQPLEEAGLFASPPAPIVDYAEETVGSPPWPQSRYLARMAPYSPKEVLRVALSVAGTANDQIHEDLADAALALPPELAARMVPAAKQWLRSPYKLHIPEKLGKLLRKLAEAGRIDDSIDLATALFEVTASQSVNPAAQAALPEPGSHFRKFDYEKILQSEFPAVVTAAPLRALETLCDLLDRAIELSFPPGEAEPPVDFSYLWRPAMHPSDQNADKTIRDGLVTVLVETVEQIAREQPFMVPRMVEILEGRPRNLFTRASLHLIRVWPEFASDLIAARLTDRRLFDDPHFHHEYLLLARDQLEELSPEQRETIFGWIAEGPDLALWLHDPASPLPADTSPEAAELYRARWQTGRRAVLAEYLQEDQRPEDSASSEQAEFVTHHPGPRPDPTTPVQAEDLHFDKIDEVIRTLREWKPTPGLGNPTAEGLALKLAQVVATESPKFAKVAGRFEGLDPLYVWALLQGLREGGEMFTFAWEPVLDLCAWAVEQGDGSGRWRPVRLEIARLLARGFSQGSAQLPFDLRREAWAALKPLTDDPDPFAGADGVDASLQSVSTVRGEAMHSVIRYALWVRRYMESAPDARTRVARGFDELPEVREVLELHLHPGIDPSPAVRAVYGRWFAWLTMLDAGWTRERVGKIFPQEHDLEPLRDAAWEALISFSPAYDHLLATIGAEYERGLDLIGRFDLRPENKVHPENRLAEHLMVFYLRGKLALDSKGLVTRFFKEASPPLRRHALSFVGRSLNAQQGRIPPDFAMRLRSLWERRMEAVAEETDRSELAAFGWWFASGKLDEGWSLRQLGKVLELGVIVENATQVVARLKELAGKHPERAAACLTAILGLEQDSASILGWAEDARAIVNSAMQSGDAAARTLGIELLRFFDVQELEELVRWE